MTQLPMGMMSLLFSASGRKLAGETAPCSGAASAAGLGADHLAAAGTYLGW